MYGDLSFTNRSSATHSTVIIVHPPRTACRQQSAAVSRTLPKGFFIAHSSSQYTGFPFQGAMPGKHQQFV